MTLRILMYTNLRMLQSLHHVQLAMPAGFEEQARAYYGVLLGMAEAPKPEELAKRGGVWFERGDLRIHLGVEEPFFPARKAHPAFQVRDLDALIVHLAEAGVDVKRDDALPGYKRFYANDPFGNRIEFLEAVG